VTAIIINIAGDYDARDIGRATRDLQKLGDAANNSAFAVFGEKFKTAGAKIKNTGEKLTLGVTLPLVGIGIAAVSTQAQYETTMNQLAVATDAPVEAMTRLKDLAKQLGAETVFSANDAAEAMLELAKGGFTPAQIAGGGVQATMALAATEGMALADAATITSNAMNTFGIKAKNAARIADALAGGSIASSASVEGLAQALSQVGPGASNAGLNMRQTVGVLAAFADNGIKGSDAGTSLKTMLARLVPSTKEAAAEMERLGLDFVDAKGNIVPITNVAKQLQDKLGGMSEAQRIAALQTIFGSDATRAATVLMKEGASGLQTYIDATSKSGAANEMAAARMEGTAGAMEKVKGTIETALLAIGEALAPIITQVSDFVREWVDRFQQLDPATQKVIVIVGLLAAAIGPVLIVMGLVVGAIGSIMTALAAVSAPVLAVVAVIGLIVAAVVLLWNKSEAFRTAVINVWNAVKSAVQSAIDGIKRKLDENKDKIDAFKEGLAKVWEFIQTYVIPAIAKFYEVYLTNLIKVIGWVVERLIDWYSFLWDVGVAAVDVGKKVWNFGVKVKDAVQAALKWIGELPDKVKAWFADAGTWLVNAGKAIVDGLWDGIRGAWDSFTGWIEEKINALPEAVKKVLGIASPSKVFFEIGSNVVKGFVDGVNSGKADIEASARESFAETLNAKVNEALDTLRARLDAAKAEFTSFKDTVVSSITQAFSFGDAYQAAQNAGMTFLEALTAQANQATAFADRIKQLVVMGLSAEAIQMVLSAGVQAGTSIANELIAGGATAIAQTNDLVTTTQAAATRVGVDAAASFYGAGVKNAQDTLDGFKKEFGKGGPGREKLMRIMDYLAEDAARQVRVNVEVTRNINEVVTRITQSVQGRASGGPVQAGTPYFVGEAGIELFVPRTSGTIIPNQALTGGGRGSVTVAPGAVQITVQGGNPTDVQAAVDEAFARLVREMEAM
jgi:TP901 family phage tail tape measure protein